MNRPPELTTDDLARWRRVVRVAAHCASHPRASAADLAIAAKRARKARVPGKLHRDDPAVRLLDAADLYAKRDAVGRAANAPELADLAAEVRRQLDRLAEQDAAPPSRYRADLDG